MVYLSPSAFDIPRDSSDNQLLSVRDSQVLSVLLAVSASCHVFFLPPHIPWRHQIALYIQHDAYYARQRTSAGASRSLCNRCNEHASQGSEYSTGHEIVSAVQVVCMICRSGLLKAEASNWYMVTNKQQSKPTLVTSNRDSVAD